MVGCRGGHDRRQGDVLVGDDRKRGDGQRAIEFKGLVAKVENIPALLKQREHVKDTIQGEGKKKGTLASCKSPGWVKFISSGFALLRYVTDKV